MQFRLQSGSGAPVLARRAGRSCPSFPASVAAFSPAYINKVAHRDQKVQTRGRIADRYPAIENGEAGLLSGFADSTSAAVTETVNRAATTVVLRSFGA